MRGERGVGDLAWLGLVITVVTGVLVGLGLVVLIQNLAHGTVVGASGEVEDLQAEIPHLASHSYAHLSETPDVSSRYLTLEPDDTWTWAEVAVGDHDNDLRRWSAALSAVGPRMVTFSHEPMTGQHVMYGGPRDFRKAWRHVHDILDGPRVTWVWNVTWTSMTNTQPTEREYPDNWWPGRNYADAVSAEVFNWSGCKGDWTSFGSKANQIQAWADYYGKPVVFAEVGSNQGRAQWVRHAARWVAHHDVLGLFYFQSPHPEHGCEWRLTTDDEIASLRGMIR